MYGYAYAKCRTTAARRPRDVGLFVLLSRAEIRALQYPPASDGRVSSSPELPPLVPHGRIHRRAETDKDGPYSPPAGHDGDPGGRDTEGVDASLRVAGLSAILGHSRRAQRVDDTTLLARRRERTDEGKQHVVQQPAHAFLHLFWRTWIELVKANH